MTTITQLTEIVNGSLVPSNKKLDGSLVQISTDVDNKRFASLQKDQPTLKTCAGYLHSSSSTGSLSSMTMVAAAGTVQITAIGY